MEIVQLDKDDGSTTIVAAKRCEILLYRLPELSENKKKEL